jgi:hypothetical protein
VRAGLVETTRLMAAALVAATVVACGDGYGGPPGPTPTIDIGASRTALSVVQGSSGAVEVTLTRGGGFADAVSIAVTGAPAGVTATPAPGSIAPGSTSSTITIAVAATATPGTSTLTVQATGPGVTQKTVPLTLTVTPVPAGANTTWEFCTGAAPIWFAAQDGEGTWAQIAPTGSKFVFDIASGRGGVAFVTSAPGASGLAAVSLAHRLPRMLEAATLIRDRVVHARAAQSRGMAPSAGSAADEFELSIVYGTQAELNALGRTQCAPATGRTVNGTVGNLGARSFADVTLGDSYSVVVAGATPAVTPTFQLLDVADGTVDLIASRTGRDPATDAPVIDRMIIRRGLNQANNSTLPVLDFSAAEAFVTTETTIEVGNLAGSAAFLFTFYYTSGAADAFTGLDGPRPGPFRHRGVPSARQQPGDLHLAAILANGSSDSRVAGVFFRESKDRTITLGDVLPAPTVEAVSTAPYARLRAAGSLTAAYNKHVSVSFAQAGRRTTIAASAGYRSNATTYDLTIPDFTGVPGWVNEWGAKRGVPTNWTLTGANFTGVGTTELMPAEGATIQSATKTGSVTP